MDDLLAARLQMGISLGFHIIFACIGMAMPFLMAFAEWRWLRTGHQVYRELAVIWSKGVAVFFAVGAVSGTVLSFELGLLWPTFMEHAGPVFGMPFSWEGSAFFLEAIALGVFLYGWDRVGKWTHWVSGLVVGISGVLSGIFVIAANGWMNSPAGFDIDADGNFINIDPYAAMFNDAWLSQAQHMTFAAFLSTAMAVAGLHALLLLKYPHNILHQKAFRIAMGFVCVFALVQPLSGDFAAKDVAERQPVKLAAMEAHFKTRASADLILGGIPDEELREVNYAIHLPGFLSYLAHGDFDATVLGLEAFPQEEWPPVLITHLGFQVMVLCGSIMALIALVYLVLFWKWPGKILSRPSLWIIGLATPLGFIAVEAGWVVTEVGRQPWIIYGVMKTTDAVSPMPGLQVTCYIITAVYLLLTILLVWILRWQIKKVNTL